MAQRYTFMHIGKQGQLRPYGDSFTTVQLLVECSGNEGDADWVPFDIIEDRIKDVLKANKHVTGYTDYVYKPEDGEGGYFSRRFGYLKKISPGLWELQTYSKFTD